MKTLFFSLFILMGSITFAQTQTSMAAKAGSDFKKTDSELNRIYQKVLAQYEDDARFVENLKSSQRLWIQLRDAEMKMKFPDESNENGSCYSMCYYNYIEELTYQRTEALKQWIDGTEEGDVCAGSQRVVTN